MTIIASISIYRAVFRGPVHGTETPRLDKNIFSNENILKNVIVFGTLK